MHDGPRSGDAEEPLRSAAIQAMSRCISPIDSQTVWRDLAQSRSAIVDEFSSDGWSFLVIRERVPHPRRLAARTLEILEEVLLGAEPKVVSIDRRLAPSTIAGNLKQAYETIGLRCKPSKVPLLLVALVHAAKGHSQIDTGRAATFEYSLSTYRVVCMPSPDRLFERVLSPAEQCVMRMRLDGMTHAEIAARRSTSRRTVANQIATAFHRLGICSRSDLMELLIAPERISARSRSAPRAEQETEHEAVPTQRAV